MRDLEPAGIGGWLLLPALGLIVAPIRQGIQIVRDYIPALDLSLLKTLSDPASAHYSPLWIPTIVFEAVANTLLVALTLWLAYLFFIRKSVMVPRLFILWLASNVVIQIVDWLLVRNLPLEADPSSGGLPIDGVRSILYAAIWIPYFMRSARVKNTFIYE